MLQACLRTSVTVAVQRPCSKWVVRLLIPQLPLRRRRFGGQDCGQPVRSWTAQAERLFQQPATDRPAEYPDATERLGRKGLCCVRARTEAVLKRRRRGSRKGEERDVVDEQRTADVRGEAIKVLVGIVELG